MTSPTRWSTGRLIRRRDEAPPDASDGIALADAGFTLDGARPFPPGPVSRLPVRLPLGKSVLGLRLDVAAGQAGAEGTIDLVLRDDHGKPAGGIAIALTVA